MCRRWCQNQIFPHTQARMQLVAGVTAQMMVLLFPGDLDYIQKKVAEEKLYRLMSGANTRSDWDAGENLGKQVANVFLARARTDKAGAAIGTQADWTKFETDAKAAGNTPWISLELPHRPPMLPLFPKVTPYYTGCRCSYYPPCCAI
jgi:hypothetical protein